MNYAFYKLLITLWATAILAISTSLYATTIQKFTFEEMVELAALIVEAEVLDVSVIDTGNVVYTNVLLAVNDVLKGENPGDYLELNFLGGESDKIAVLVSGQDIPLLGEKGFYFIEDLESKSVNPLIGWSQGHFRIITDAKGNETLLTDVQQEVMEVTDNKNTILASKLRNMKFSNRLLQETDFLPVTPDEMRDAVNLILDAE
ncbi:MAG: hypothetical protein EBS81_12880 [Gammaproteobacteria bacterium]|nr:hypothetical protein [Gammaproteobacteria bacterium]